MPLDDPRLTAFALGELNEAEAAEVAALLETDETARAYVADVRQLAAAVKAAREAEIEEHAREDVSVPPGSSKKNASHKHTSHSEQEMDIRRRRLWTALTAAAVLLLAVGLGFLASPTGQAWLAGTSEEEQREEDREEKARELNDLIDEIEGNLTPQTWEKLKSGEADVRVLLSEGEVTEERLKQAQEVIDDLKSIDSLRSRVDGTEEAPLPSVDLWNEVRRRKVETFEEGYEFAGESPDDSSSMLRSGGGNSQSRRTGDGYIEDSMEKTQHFDSSIVPPSGDTAGTSGSGGRPVRENTREVFEQVPESQTPALNPADPAAPPVIEAPPRGVVPVTDSENRESDGEPAPRLRVEAPGTPTGSEDAPPEGSEPGEGRGEGQSGGQGQPDSAEDLPEQQKAEQPNRNDPDLSNDDDEASRSANEGKERIDGEEDKDKKAEELEKERLAARKKDVATWRRAMLTPNAARLAIGDREELPLQAMKAAVQVDGFRARVLLDVFFHNDLGRQFEGDFQLRLPVDASLYFFAFGESRYQVPSEQPDMKGEPLAFFSIPRERELRTDPKGIMDEREEGWVGPKEARMVPREKAAFAYRQTVAQRVDPALVEWNGAGVFSARVFPLAPGKLHHIVIGYDVSLQEVGGDLVYQLDLPDAPQKLVEIDVAPLAGDAVDKLVVKQGDEIITGDKDAEQKFRTAGGYRFQNPEERTIELRLKDAGPLLLTGQGDGKSAYFAARFQPQLPTGDMTEQGPRDGVFLVDTSLSANPDRFNVYLKLLESILNQNRDSMPRFSVLFFNVESHWWKAEPVENTADNVAELLAFANTLSLEGATDLDQAIAAVTQREQKRERAEDFFLLSDAAATWGQRDVLRMTEQLRSSGGSLFAYSTGMSGDDSQIMNYLARETGGAVFSVPSEDQIEKAAVAHRSRPWQLVKYEISATQKDGEEPAEAGTTNDLMIAGRPRTLYDGQTLTLVGRGTPPAGAESVLHLERAGEKQTVRVSLGEALESDLAARLYGQVAVGALEETPTVDNDIAVAYARNFRITGQTCSLLMLETEEDYERFDIKPEEDAFVISISPAEELLQKAAAALEELRGDPKAAFVKWLGRMEQMPGVEFKLSPALKLAIERMPAAAFAVTPRPLACKLRAWDDLPGEFQDQHLTSIDLDYLAFRAEAERRLATSPDDALKALSSLMERKPGDGVLARDIAFSAMEWGREDQAYALFRRVALSRPYEPQTYHALARCMAAMGNVDLALLYYELAVGGTWDGRFGEFQSIVGLDYLRFLQQIERGELKCSVPELAAARLQSVDQKFGLGRPDLVVMMSWNTDGTDVDMHVIDPRGEECFYSHRDTQIGGHLSADVTQGFGPEMFVLRKAVPGEYQVRAKYYSSDANRASTRTRVEVTIFEDWGGKHEKVTRKTLTLTDGQEMHDVAKVVVEE